MVGTIVLGSNNLSDDGVFKYNTNLAPYNTFRQNLRGISLSNKHIGLKKINMYYAFPNIINSTPLTISWMVAGTYTDFTFTIPALTNYNSIATLNSALQDFMITNGLYLINGSNNVYYMEFVENQTTYKVDLNMYLVPTTSTYTQPTNFPGFPTIANTMKINIPTNSEFAKLIGFADNTTYGGGIAQIQYTSSYVPQLSPVSTIYMTCNIAKNDVPVNGPTIIAVFTTHGVSYGEMITMEPAITDMYEIDNNSNQLIVELWDQDWVKIHQLDPQTTIQLRIE